MVSIVNISNSDSNTNSDSAAKLVARPVTPLGILVQQLERIVSNAETESVSSEFKASLDRAFELVAGLEPYLEQCTTPESAALSQLTDRTQKED